MTKARRSDAFDELLWQITGELALTPASASLAAAPFIDLEPDPEPETTRGHLQPLTVPTQSTHRRPLARIAHFALAGAAALVLALGAFMVGQTSTEPAIVTAMELPDAPEDGAVLSVAHGPAIQIPAAEPEPKATAPEPEPEPEAKPKPKPKTKRKAKPKPKPDFVAFEDL